MQYMGGEQILDNQISSERTDNDSQKFCSLNPLIFAFG